MQIIINTSKAIPDKDINHIKETLGNDGCTDIVITEHSISAELNFENDPRFTKAVDFSLSMMELESYYS